MLANHSTSGGTSARSSYCGGIRVLLGTGIGPEVMVPPALLKRDNGFYRECILVCNGFFEIDKLPDGRDNRVERIGMVLPSGTPLRSAIYWAHWNRWTRTART